MNRKEVLRLNPKATRRYNRTAGDRKAIDRTAGDRKAIDRTAGDRMAGGPYLDCTFKNQITSRTEIPLI